jgi:hypothetical protein
MNYGELMKRCQPPQRPFVAEIKVVRGGLNEYEDLYDEFIIGLSK